VPHPGNGGRYEGVRNALHHGVPPTTVRIWATPDRVVVSVRDHGPGPADPQAGLVPASHRAAKPGLGLWVLHQLDLDVALIDSGEGFTIRLRAGVIPG
jgi:anti-sigma regulatory factor (Ser/Thr protein kinase)